MLIKGPQGGKLYCLLTQTKGHIKKEQKNNSSKDTKKSLPKKSGAK